MRSIVAGIEIPIRPGEFDIGLGRVRCRNERPGTVVFDNRPFRDGGGLGDLFGGQHHRRGGSGRNSQPGQEEER